MLESGSIVNEVAALFETASYFQYSCKSYCTLALVPQVDFNIIMKQFKNTKTLMIQKLFENPYDIDRNYFCLKMRENISYIKNATDINLKTMYY